MIMMMIIHTAPKRPLEMKANILRFPSKETVLMLTINTL